LQLESGKESQNVAHKASSIEHQQPKYRQQQFIGRINPNELSHFPGSGGSVSQSIDASCENIIYRQFVKSNSSSSSK